MSAVAPHVTFREESRSGTVVAVRVVDQVRAEPEIAVVEVEIRSVGENIIGPRILFLSIRVSGDQRA